MKTRNEIIHENRRHSMYLEKTYKKGVVIIRIRRMDKAYSWPKLHEYYHKATSYVDALFDTNTISLNTTSALDNYIAMVYRRNVRRLNSIGL